MHGWQRCSVSSGAAEAEASEYKCMWCINNISEAYRESKACVLVIGSLEVAGYTIPATSPVVPREQMNREAGQGTGKGREGQMTRTW